MDSLLGATPGKGSTHSGVLDWIFALSSAAGMAYLFIGLWKYDPTVTWVTLCVWAFLGIRMHVCLYLAKGMPAFIHICKRFPTAWLNTMVYLPIFFVSKVIAFVLCEILSLDGYGIMYKLGTGVTETSSPDGLNKVTMKRYKNMVMDLEKPLLSRNSKTWLDMAICPFMLSSRIAANIYQLGPYTGFGVLTLAISGNSIVFRNGLLGTHPAYNYHVTFFEDTDGEMKALTCQSLIPGIKQVYDSVWRNYLGDHILPMLLDSESRRVVGDKQSLLEEDRKASIDRWTPVVEGEPLLFHDVVPNLPKQDKVKSL